MRALFVAVSLFSGFALAADGPLKELMDGLDGRALVEAGIPAMSREWMAHDYEAVAKVLESGKVPLPRVTDVQGRMFFQRLTSPENLRYYRIAKLPAGNRMEDYGAMLEASLSVMKQYLEASNNGVKVSREMAMQMGFILKAGAVGVELMEEILKTVSPDALPADRRTGLKRIQSGLTNIVAGAEESLNERFIYTPEDLSILLNDMAETLPTLKRLLAVDYQLELRNKLKVHMGNFPRVEDKQKLEKMIGELGK